MTTWRDGVGREVGGGLRRAGTYVCLWPVHVDVWQKPSQYYNYPPIKIKIFTCFKGALPENNNNNNNNLGKVIHFQYKFWVTFIFKSQRVRIGRMMLGLP